MENEKKDHIEVTYLEYNLKDIEFTLLPYQGYEWSLRHDVPRQREPLFPDNGGSGLDSDFGPEPEEYKNLPADASYSDRIMTLRKHGGSDWHLLGISSYADIEIEKLKKKLSKYEERTVVGGLAKLLEKIEKGDDAFSTYLPTDYEELWPLFYRAFRGSVDAAITIQKAMLPDCTYQIHQHFAYINTATKLYDEHGKVDDNSGRSLLIATLKKKIALEYA